MIKKEDLLPGTTAKYGIEFESIIMDRYKQDYICTDEDHVLYDNDLKKQVTDSMREFMNEYDINDIFNYHPSLNCQKVSGGDKRVEFASRPFRPSQLKPSVMFNELSKLIDAFNEWTGGNYYLPDHGSIAYFNNYLKTVSTTVTGGTHITISFPLTIHDNPIRWKIFIQLFIGLITMYQPIYIALNGASSSFTKGSERQRVSGSVMIGSAYMYNMFATNSERYEFFLNSPKNSLDLPEYPSYSHWLNKDIEYKQNPWRANYKCDIGNSEQERADSFELNNNIDDIYEKRDELINKDFYKLIGTLAEDIRGATSNLIEFRFFDNEPIKYLLEKFNLIIRIADYAYEQSKDMEAAVGIDGLKNLLNTSIDDKLNIRPLVNKKAWHDAVIQSMKDGSDTIFTKEFIDECYNTFYLTDFNKDLESLQDISAIDLHKIFVDKMNTSTRYFSEYFQTDNPKPIYSKNYQIEMYNESTIKAQAKMNEFLVEQAKKEEEEKQRIAKVDEDRRIVIKNIILENISKSDYAQSSAITDFVDFDKLSATLRFKIYDEGENVKEISDDHNSLFSSITFFNTKQKDIDLINIWFKESLLPDLRNKEPRLRIREDDEDRIREQTRERERQSQRERDIIEQQISLIEEFVQTNISNLDTELKDTILTTIDLDKLSNLLRELIYEDKVNISYINNDASTNLYVSTHEDVIWNTIPQENQNLLIKWFRESLLPMLEENIPQLHERSIQTTQETHEELPQQPEQQSENEALTILNIINNNVSNLSNSDMRNIIHSSIWYDKMAEVLQRWIYQSHFTTLDIRNNIDLLIDHSLQHPTHHNQETYELLRTWIIDYLIDDLQHKTPLQPGGLDALFV